MDKDIHMHIGNGPIFRLNMSQKKVTKRAVYNVDSLHVIYTKFHVKCEISSICAVQLRDKVKN